MDAAVCKNLIEKHVSGLVLNIGPYIKAIPAKVISYCNENNFPLMDIPWKTRIVDISRDFCNQIILNERKEETIGDTLKNFIFSPAIMQNTFRFWSVMILILKQTIQLLA